MNLNWQVLTVMPLAGEAENACRNECHGMSGI